MISGRILAGEQSSSAIFEEVLQDNDQNLVRDRERPVQYSVTSGDVLGSYADRLAEDGTLGERLHSFGGRFRDCWRRRLWTRLRDSRWTMMEEPCEITGLEAIRNFKGEVRLRPGLRDEARPEYHVGQKK